MKSRCEVKSVVAMTVAASLSLGAASGQGPLSDEFSAALAEQLPDESAVTATKTKVIDGKSYTFVKYRDDAAAFDSRIFNSEMQQFDEENIPISRPQVLSARLGRVLEAAGEEGAVVRVNVALHVETIDEPEFTASGSGGIELVDGVAQPGIQALEPDIMLNNVAANAEQYLAAEEARALRAAAVEAIQNKQLRRKINTLALRHDLVEHPAIAQGLAENRSTVSMHLNGGDIRELLEGSQDIIAGIELYVEPKDQIEAAMKSSRVDPYAIDHAGRKGSGIGIYMTESGCANAGHITNYKKIAGSRTNHSENVSSIMRAVSPKSYIYCRGGAVLPTNTDLLGYGGKPKIYVVNRSNGGGDNDSYTTTDRDWDNFVYDKAVATFVSAGNNGDDNGYIIYPAKGLNIISSGAYNDANNTIASFSSYKDPETGNKKPELSTPGVSIKAGGHTMSGTSMSSPHSAAFAADLMGAYSVLKSRPYLVKSLMMAGATKSLVGGTDKVGLGGADFRSAYYSFWYHWYQGGNGAYTTWDAGDPYPNNGYVDTERTLNANLSKVRVVLCWLNRGTYTYSHRNDAHPIGMDLDLAVFDPNGNLVGSSSSWDNPYEVVNFDPTVTGKYRFRIKRYANRDTSSKLHMAVVVNWY